MMQRLKTMAFASRLALGALALGALSCSSGPDPCATESGTCLALRIEGDGSPVETVQIRISGPGVSHRFERDVSTLPALLPLSFESAGTSAVSITAQGLHAGTAVLRGDTTAELIAGSRSAATVTLAAFSCSKPPCTIDPAPTPVSAVPDTGPTSGGIIVAVNGTDFVSGQGLQVAFDGTPATLTAWVSPTQLIATLPPRIGKAGPATITVRNPDGQQTALSGAFSYNFSQLDFGAPSEISFPANSNPNSIALGDFNGDGRTDAAIANQGDNSVGILIGLGDGKFSPPAYVKPSTDLSGPTSVAAADLNGDKILDLVIAAPGTQKILIWLGKGDGSFNGDTQGNASLNFMATGISGLALGDYNNDQKQDIFYWSNQFNAVGYFKNSGPNGNLPRFDAAAVLMPNIEKPVAVLPYDMDGDKKDDYVVISQPTNGMNNLQIILSGSGTVYQKTLPCILTGIDGFDVNNDKKQDLAVSCNDAGVIAVLLGKLKGDVEVKPIYYGVGPYPYSVTAADVSGDGKPDLVVSTKYRVADMRDKDNTQISVFINDGSGNLGQARQYTVKAAPGAVAIGNLDRDKDLAGRPDLMVASGLLGVVSVLLSIAQ